MSVFVCVYLFMLACMKIHFALLAIERGKIIFYSAQTKSINWFILDCRYAVLTIIGRLPDSLMLARRYYGEFSSFTRY